MPTPTRDEIQNAILTREPAARAAGFHPSNLDRLVAEGRLHPIVNENGRAIAFMRDEILWMIGARGTFNKKPPGKPKGSKQSASKREKENAV